MKRGSAAIAAAVAAAALIAGCASRPPNSELDLARAAYQNARANPITARVAPDELKSAAASLQRAESAWREGRDSAEVSHLAYLARQQAALASSIGAQREAENEFNQAVAERDQLRLQERDREANLARERARSAELQQRTAQRQAANAAEQAQAAQQQAEAARQQAESVQQQASVESQQAQDERGRAAAAEEQAAAQAARAQQLEQQLKGLEARSTSRGTVVTLRDFVFDPGKADLQEGGTRTISRLADVLKQHPERKVLVEGFTDNTGSAESNRELSRERADAVRDALVDRGVAPDRISTRGFGEAYPIAGNATPAGRQLNRRVEIVLSDASGRLPSR